MFRGYRCEVSGGQEELYTKTKSSYHFLSIVIGPGTSSEEDIFGGESRGQRAIAIGVTHQKHAHTQANWQVRSGAEIRVSIAAEGLQYTCNGKWRPQFKKLGFITRGICIVAWCMDF